MTTILLLWLTISIALVESPAPASTTQPFTVVLCSNDEPGRRLILEGRVLDYSGKPLSKAAVIAYNADAAGLYNPSNSLTRVPRIRGVAVTDEFGQYRFETVWPGAYPNETEPGHVHMEISAPAHHARHIALWFEGDPLITPDQRRRAEQSDNVEIVRAQESSPGPAIASYEIRLSGN